MSDESTTARPARFAAGSGANGGASGVTLTAQELAAALRLGDSPEELAQATRLLAYATEAVEKNAPEAPETGCKTRLQSGLRDTCTTGL